MEPTAGIHSIDGMTGAHAYLVRGADGWRLVDTGMPGNAERILRCLAELGAGAKDLTAIILTHSDVDHIGSLAELKRRTGARILIHQEEAPVLSGKREGKKVKGPLGALMRVAMKLMKIHMVPADGTLKDGDTVGPLRVVNTPGHTPGHICLLHEASATLIAGDAVRVARDGTVVPSPRIMNQDTEQALESVGRIAKLEFDALLPGHGVPLLHGAAEQVRKLARGRGVLR